MEDRIEEDNSTGIFLKEVVKDGLKSETVFERRLFRCAARAKLWFPGDQVSGSIVMAFESYGACKARSHLSVVHYASV